MESRFYVKYNMERAEFDRQYTVVQYRPNCTKMLGGNTIQNPPLEDSYQRFCNPLFHFGGMLSWPESDRETYSVG